MSKILDTVTQLVTPSASALAKLPDFGGRWGLVRSERPARAPTRPALIDAGERSTDPTEGATSDNERYDGRQATPSTSSRGSLVALPRQAHVGG